MTHLAGCGLDRDVARAVVGAQTEEQEIILPFLVTEQAIAYWYQFPGSCGLLFSH